MIKTTPFIRSSSSWRELFEKCKILPNKDKGWVGYGDWLGTGYIAPSLRKHRPFKQARKFAHSLGLRTQIEWRTFTKSGKLPDDIPADPRRVYKEKGWINIGDWLGTDKS